MIAGGPRVVEVRNTSGELMAITRIPGTSAFGQRRTAARCSFTADEDGTTYDGQSYVAGDLVESTRWIFREGGWSSQRLHPPAGEEPVLGRPLTEAFRQFSVYCDRATISNFMYFRIIPGTDEVFNPETQAEEAFERLQLVRPVVYPNPIVDRFGGLVVRYPSWLGIRPDAWSTQVGEPAIDWRGWWIDVVAQPAELEFQVDFVPDPEEPSPAFRGIVPCVAGVSAPSHDGVVLPAMPELPEQTEPGVNGDCMWTPPGPGSVTIQARITYRITLRANEFVTARPDYEWTSEPVTFVTGELTSVNLDPTR